MTKYITIFQNLRKVWNHMTLYHEYTQERNIMIVVVAIYLSTCTLIV